MQQQLHDLLSAVVSTGLTLGGYAAWCQLMVGHHRILWAHQQYSTASQHISEGCKGLWPRVGVANAFWLILGVSLVPAAVQLYIRPPPW